MKYLKGGWVEHPVEDWGKGVVLEDADGLYGYDKFRSRRDQNVGFEVC